MTLSFNFACFWSSNTSSHNLGVMWRRNQKRKSAGHFFSLDLPNEQAWDTHLYTQGPHGTGCLEEVAWTWDIWVPGHIAWPANSSEDGPDLSWPRIKNTKSSMLKRVMSAFSRVSCQHSQESQHFNIRHWSAAPHISDKYRQFAEGKWIWVMHKLEGWTFNYEMPNWLRHSLVFR